MNAMLQMSLGLGLISVILAQQLTQCQKEEAQAVKDQENNMIGGFRPSCDNEGFYSAFQSHGGSGFSWCALGDGTKIGYTVSRPGSYSDGFPFNCQVERQKAEAGYSP